MREKPTHLQPRPNRIPGRWILFGCVLCATAASGCRMEAVQSILHPAGPAAAEIASLWWVMFGLGTAVLVIVTVLMLYSAFAGPAETGDDPPSGHMRFIVIGGLVIPAVILTVMLFFALSATLAIRSPETEVTVEVVAHKFWWEIRYPRHGIVTANEIHIPAGVPVRLVVRSADVVHSFWVPALHGKIDAFPDVVNTFWIQAERTGRFRGQCAEFCGVQHARMAFLVVALSPEEFSSWIAERQAPHPEPETELLLRGRQAFFDSGCNDCHAIRGTDAISGVGPDLTHIGSRLSLGAVTIPNTHGNLAGWIVNPQPIKPGNFMPPTFMTSEELHALVAYLRSLE